jgi:L-fucose isomerase-like protein
MSQKFGFIPIRPDALLDEEEFAALIGDYVHALEERGGERWSADALPHDDAHLFVLVATGGTEQLVLELWENRQKSVPEEPLFLIAHPGNNSLPAALEVLARLQQYGARGRIFYLEGPDDTRGLQEISDAVHDETVRRSLLRARIGLVGSPSDWLVASSPHFSIIKEVWGPTVVPIEMNEVVGILENYSDADVEPCVSPFAAGAEKIVEPSPTELLDVARVYLALKQIVADHALDAVSVRCFDFVQNQKTTGCFALAKLSDEGHIAGCEGDLVSTVSLLWAHELLGVTPWMANPAQLDPVHNSLVLAHCTVPCTLVESYRLRSHFESGLGVGIQGNLPAGPVTLLRIGGKWMDQLWLSEGEILRTGDAENLCRTQVEIRLQRGGNVSDLLRRPLGNHLGLVFGHHLDRLRGWWETKVISDAPPPRSS